MKKFALIFIPISCLNGLANAATNRTISDPMTLSGARTAGRGGATVATPGIALDSLFMNPASAGFEKKYVVSGAYRGQGESLVASIVDFKSGPIGGGLYYARRNFDDDSVLAKNPGMGSTRRIEDRAGVSVFGKLSDDFSLGAVAKWGKYDSKEDTVKDFKKWNFNVGAQYQLNREISVGVVGQNLLKDNQGLDPSMVAGGLEARLIQGLALSAQLFRFSKASSLANFKYDNPNKVLGWGAGVEYFFKDAFGLRGGFKDNPTWSEKVVSAGASYQTNSFTVDYSLEILTEQDNEQYHTVAFSALF